MAHLIGRARPGELRVADEAGRIVAALVLLYRRSTRVARTDSIAVSSAARPSAEARVSNRESRMLFVACGFSEARRLVDYCLGEQGACEDGVRLV